MAQSIAHHREADPVDSDDRRIAGARPIVRLLIISDRDQHRTDIENEAKNAGFDTRVVPDARRAIESDPLDWNPDAVLLDQLLSRGDQYATIRALRSAFGVMAFVVSDVRDDAYSFVQGVYFAPRQGIIAEARLFNEVIAGQSRYLEFSDLRLDTCIGRASFSGRTIELARDETVILSTLIVNQGSGVPRRTLAAAIGVQRDLDPRIVDVHVVRLMVKLGDVSPIRIERTPNRQGYLLSTLLTHQECGGFSEPSDSTVGSEDIIGAN